MARKNYWKKIKGTCISKRKKKQRKEYPFVKTCLETATPKLLIVKWHEWKQNKYTVTPTGQPRGVMWGWLCQDSPAGRFSLRCSCSLRFRYNPQ